MDRTAASNYLLNGGLRQYQDVNQALNIQGTSLVAADRNAVQEELLAVQAFTGIVPAAANWGQVIQSIARLTQARVTTITASTALTVDQTGVVLVSAAAGNVVLTLPASTGANGATPVSVGWRFIRTDTSGNTVTFAASGSDVFTDAGWNVVGAPSLAPGFPITIGGDGNGHWLVSAHLRGSVLITSSGNWTVPAGVTAALAEAWGGGGGGPGNPVVANTAVATNGSAGAYGRKLLTGLSGGMVIPITIGAPGAGGAAGGANGGTGGATSVGSYFTVAGGGGGLTGSGSLAPGGALPSGVDFGLAGGVGSLTVFSGSSPIGIAGTAPRGGSGAIPQDAGTPLAGGFPGGGGATGISTTTALAGSAGGAGAVFIRY